MDDVLGRSGGRDVLLGSGRRCTATARHTGGRCGRAPIPGGLVCASHGGKAPGVAARAAQRLQSLVEPALARLNAYLESRPPCGACGRADLDRDPTVLRAIQLVLDRTGFHPTLAVEPAAPERLGAPYVDWLTDQELVHLAGLIHEAKRRMGEGEPPAARNFDAVFGAPEPGVAMVLSPGGADHD
jgi:hypothetical protein